MKAFHTHLAATALAVAMIPQFAAGDEAADIEAVRQANAAFLKNAAARDIDVLATMWRQDGDVRAIHPFRPIDEGWDKVREGFAALFEIFPEMESVMADPHIQVNGDMAWVTGHEEFRGVLGSGDVVELTLRTSRIFEREGDAWLLVQHQVSPPPHE